VGLAMSETGKTVTRVDLCEAVYQKVGLSRSESSAFVELVVKEISDCLERGETVKLSSFGSFIVRKKGQRVGRNPKTGAITHHRSSRYTKWIASAGKFLMAQQPPGGFKTIHGPFAMTIIINRAMMRKNADLDNRCKAIGDALQRFGIISNDKNAVRIVTEYGQAPDGLRVILEELS